jgi:hypothetical protein
MLFWTPRILGILFILFIGMFSLDVFGMGGGFWATLGGFFIHNIPAIVLLIAMMLGWRREWVAAVGFAAFGAWYLTSVRGFDLGTYLLLAGVPLLVAVLFLLGWIFRRQIRTH